LRDQLLHGWLLLIALAALSSFLPASAEQEEPKLPDPFEVDYIEETGVELMLLDVEVYDDDGLPIRGLAEEDFTLTINGRVQQIYSVDDLCSCNEQPARVAGMLEENAEPAAEAEGMPAAATSEPMIYVLYINFGQLMQDGRVHALAEVRRWINETMQERDRVLLLAWSAQAGLKVLSPVTSEKKGLLEAIDQADRDPKFVDPFPVLRPTRQQEVIDCWRICESPCKPCEMLATDYAQQEYSHGKWSMGALQQALYALEREPGRKTLLYFYQNDTLMPARLFVGTNQQHVMDQVRMLDRTAADASLSRTSIVAAYSGSDPSASAINVGANLADYTGGAYSRAAHLTPALTREAGRGCRCLYRIAVVPPPRGRDRVYNASVWVHDQRVPRRFRLQHLSRFDRWLREAQAALATPELMGDLPVTASLTPLAMDKGRWSVAVQVAVSADALLLLPAAGGRFGSWEAGALMYRDDGSDPTEFLARSRLSTNSDDSSGSYIVHQGIIEGLKPGSWRLGAFVRDRNANLFGGAENETVLPRPGKLGLSTPVLLQSGRSWLRTELPILKKKPDPTSAGAVVEGPLPLSGEPVGWGNPVEVRTWVCAPNKGGAGRLLRYLVRDEEPIFRLDHADPPPAGSCTELVDVVETRFLTPGEYAYRLRYNVPQDGKMLEDEATFVLEEPPPAPSSNVE
jgi:hypothetical protein